MKVKPCVKCGARDRNKSGYCKPCRKLTDADRYKSNPEKAKLAATKWRKSNSEKIKITAANWYKSNSEKIKLAAAAWYKANSEKKKLAGANWQKANPEKVKAFVTKWNKANPEVLRIVQHNRRARKRASGGKLSANLAETLYARQKGKCVCCGKPLGSKYHLDHIMPIALGGANEDWNMQLLRASCNHHKSAKHPIEYMQEKGFLL